jgi:hypothetical protein
MDTEDAVDFVAQALHEKWPEWTIEQARAMVGHARESIATNPQRFVDMFLDNLAALEATAAVREP